MRCFLSVLPVKKHDQAVLVTLKYLVDPVGPQITSADLTVAVLIFVFPLAQYNTRLSQWSAHLVIS